jgi:DNA-directed RNA polymerase
MKRIFALCLLVMAGGCGGFRFAPTEEQKQNAWLHNRTAILAAEAAKDEFASEKLQALTKVSENQSRAFVAYTGLPQEFPKAETAEDVLSEASMKITSEATKQSAQRPDVWQLTDSTLEFAITVCSVLGGVYGTRAVRFLRQARTKQQALKEIIEGNELFKKLNTESAEAFKNAQKGQSRETRQIVALLKN